MRKETIKNAHGVMVERTAPAPKPATRKGPPTCMCAECNSVVLKSTTVATVKGRICKTHSGAEVAAIIARAVRVTGMDPTRANKCWICALENPCKIYPAPDDDDFRTRKVLRSFQATVNLLDHVLACDGCKRNMKLEG